MVHEPYVQKISTLYLKFSIISCFSLAYTLYLKVLLTPTLLPYAISNASLFSKSLDVVLMFGGGS